MREKFIAKNFRAKSRIIIRQANAILEEYSAQGFTLTLRQVFYQFVDRGLLPNTQKNYKRLGGILDDARKAGMIDWDLMEDRVRNVHHWSFWENPQQILDGSAQQYREDLWDRQKYRPEVWIEKDALVGVVEPVCRRYRVPYFACRGYVSASETYGSGKRFAAMADRDQIPIVLYLGDHDPSGLQMTEDLEGRLALFAEQKIEIRRLGLNMDQVTSLKLPHNPAKEKDARFAKYEAIHGARSWELDALKPAYIDDLIERELLDLIDPDPWGAAKADEAANKKPLAALSKHWPAVVKFLEKQEKK